MTKYIYQIGDTIKDVTLSKSLVSILYGGQTLNTEIHDFIQHELKDKDKISAIVIPINPREEDNDFIGLQIGMHIRLTKELGANRFLPLIFLSDIAFENPNEILQEQILRQESELTSLLLFTGSTYFCSPEEIQSVLPTIKGLTEEHYRKQFLPTLKLKQPIATHSLANQWGAIQLARITGNEIPENRRFDEIQKTLYFKYLTEIRKISSDSSHTKKTIQSANKKILLIDDEADKGWEDVLKLIFERAIITTQKVNTLGELTAEKANFENGVYDLILLDLRLNPTEEEKQTFIQSSKTTDYSGAEVLKKIKNLNPGNQVIIFTASNKAWNMKELMQAGYEADGYYIKESPEFYFDENFSSKNFENFKRESEKGLKKNYLRGLFIGKKKIVEHLKEHPVDIVQQIKAYLDLSLNNLKRAEIDTEYAISYLLLFQILECLHDYFIDETPSDFKEIKYKDGKGLKQFSLGGKGVLYIKGESLKSQSDGRKRSDYNITYYDRFYNLMAIKLKIQEEKVVGPYAQIAKNSIEKRNNFVHPPSEQERTKFIAADCESLFDLVSKLLLAWEK